MPHLVVGLGNPGTRYATTRHNVGYRVIDALRAGPALEGMTFYKPTSFMNSCGGPIQRELAALHGQPQNLLVICDDFSIPLGTLRIRPKGSSGGHNGLNSILQTFGTDQIPRLRMGIGPVPAGEDPAVFVLDHFSKEENKEITSMINRAADAVRVIAQEGIEMAMNRFNGKGPE